MTLALPQPLLAHQRLLGSTPANGAHVSAVPRELRFVFHEPARLTFTRVELHMASSTGKDGVAPSFQ